MRAAATVTTVEGLAADGRLHPLQEAFADLGAAQCGYCTPGFLVTAKALLDEHPHPTRDQIQEALVRQPVPLHRLSADLRGGRSRDRVRPRGEPLDDASSRRDDPMNIIGIPRRRVDGRAKVTGQTRFADDLMLPRMVHCKLLRSTVPHARIVRIDVVARARRTPASTWC